MNAKRPKKKTPLRSGCNAARAKRAALRIAARPGNRQQGLLFHNGRVLPVALGRSGIRHAKREGDGATPAGTWHALRVLWRVDRGARPRGRLPVRPIRREDGWCDDPSDRRYNRPVRLPCRASHETMWRDDGLYDIVVVLDHNTRPRKAKGGSAVFLHLARPDFTPTAGCVAFRPADLRRLLAALGPGTRLKIG